MNMLRNGLGLLADQLVGNASDAVVYNRGSTSLTLSAIRGSSSFEVADDDDIQTTFESRDWIVRAIDFQAMFPPQKYDQIVVGDQAYEILSISNAPHYRYSDEYRTMIRIHTKRIDAS